MRRLAPRPIGRVLPGVVGEARPATLLARVQAIWPEVAGRALAASTAAVSERDGTVTVVCESAVWAQELELLQRDLVERLREALEEAGGGKLERLRFSVGSLPNDR
jgi:predicted nucleic acid-binding Zn ribbon protein